MLRHLRRTASLLLCCPPLLAGTLYVDANLMSGAGDGSTWADAFQGARGLRDAVQAAQTGDVIFVAQGVYRPAIGSNRNVSITLLDGVEIYGGFLGGETSPDQRPPFGTAPTILDGDLAGDDGSGQFGDNSYHCLRAGNAGPSAIFDGFVVRGGNADGSGNNDKGAGILCISGAPTLRNCLFVDHRCTFGGAAGYINGSGPTFTDCTFAAGDGGSFGGAFDIATGASGIRFERCVFTGNRAARAGALEVFATAGVVVSDSIFIDNVSTGSGGGGAIWTGSGSSLTLTGCTLVGNRSDVQTQGGLRSQSATVTMRNTILWANEGPGGAQGASNQLSSGLDVTYCLVQGSYPGAGNLSSDPLFVDLALRDLHLTGASPAIDAGDNGTLALSAFDAAHAPRRVDEPAVVDSGLGNAPIVDMGAFESSIGISEPTCVPLPNSTGLPSILAGTGSTSIADNDVNLVVLDLPSGEFTMPLLSASTDRLPVASGLLCLGAPQIRFTGNIQSSGSTGSVSFSPDLSNLPQGTAVQPGETWTFQLWHRDGASSNFSSSLSLTWR